METQGQRFAAIVLARFEQMGLFTDAEVLIAGGPSSSTMTAYRRARDGEGDLAEPRNPVWRKIEQAAGWAAGSARRVWAGQDPVEASAPGAVLKPGPGSYVAAPGERAESGVSNEEILEAIREMRADIEALKRGQQGRDSGT